MSTAHVIGRKLLDLDFYSRAEADAMQNTVSRIVHEQLSKILERRLDAHAIAGSTIHIDQLVLDVGDIPYDELQTELPLRFERELEKQLAERIQEIFRTPGETNYTKKENHSQLELFRHFLNEGTIPWWTTGSTKNFLAECLRTLATTQARELFALLHFEGKKQPVLRRIVFQFSDPQLETIVTVLEPAHAGFIIGYSRELDAAQNKKPVQGQSSEKFRTVKWELIIGFLISDKGSDFNRRAFLKHTIAGIAARYGVSYHELLKQLVEVTKALPVPSGAASTLPALLQSLELESDEEQLPALQKKTRAGKELTDDELLQENLDLFRYILLHGSIPYRESKMKKSDIRILLQGLLVEAPLKLVDLLRNTASYPQVIPRFISHTTEQLLKTTVRTIEPANAGHVIDFVKTITKVAAKKHRVFVPEQEFSKALWNFVLRYILEDHGTQFSSRIFVKTTLARLAQHYSLSYSKLLGVVYETVKNVKKEIAWSPSLASVIDYLYSESRKTNTGEIAEEFFATHTDLAVSDNLQMGDFLLYYFTEGKIPWWAKGKYEAADVDFLFQTLLRENERYARQLLEKVAKEDELFTRLVKHLDEENIALVLKKMTVREQEPLSDWLMAVEKELNKKGGSKKKSTLFVHQLRVRLLQQLGSAEKTSFSAPAFLIEIMGELKVRYGFQLREIILLMAEAAAHLPVSLRKTMVQLLQKMHEQYAPFLYEKMYKEEMPTPERLAAQLWQEELFLSREKSSIRSRMKQEIAAAERALAESRNKKEMQSAEQLTFEHWLENDTLSYQWLEEQLKTKPAALSPERLELLSWLKEKGKYFFHEEAGHSTGEEVAAWITIALNAEQPFLPDIKNISWQDIAAIAQLMYPENYRELLPKLRKIFGEFRQRRAQLLQLLPGIEKLESQLLISAGAGVQEPSAQVDVLLRKLLEKHPEDLKVVLFQWMESRYLRRRMVNVVRDETLASILALLAGKSSPLSLALLTDTLNLWKGISKELPEIINEKIVQEAALLISVRMKTIPMGSVQWIQALLSITGKTAGMDAHTLAANWKQYGSRYAREWKSELLLLLQHLSDPLYLDKLGDRFLARLAKMSEEIKREEELKKKLEKVKKENDEGSGIIIQNAGLALLVPFLQRLFTRLEYIAENRFVSEEMRHRAIKLLQFIVDGNEEHQEYELLFNKLLCGMETQEAPDKSIALTEHEKETAEGMLGAVIQNWSALGKTSVAGLRETFLQRKGRLAFADGKWELKVERKAFDKLLLRLPWSINLIRLHWMVQPIFVEWKT